MFIILLIFFGVLAHSQGEDIFLRTLNYECPFSLHKKNRPWQKAAYTLKYWRKRMLHFYFKGYFGNSQHNFVILQVFIA